MARRRGVPIRNSTIRDILGERRLESRFADGYRYSTPLREPVQPVRYIPQYAAQYQREMLGAFTAPPVPTPELINDRHQPNPPRRPQGIPSGHNVSGFGHSRRHRG